MSIRWHLRSSRPSSNTANKPTGPVPMMTTSVVAVTIPSIGSALPLGDADHQAVERVGDLDLARQPRVRSDVKGEVEHVLLHRLGFADGLCPRLVDVDVAGGAGAGSAAFRLDARHGTADGVLHHRRAVFGLDVEAGAVIGDVSKFGHQALRGRRVTRAGIMAPARKSTAAGKRRGVTRWRGPACGRQRLMAEMKSRASSISRRSRSSAAPSPGLASISAAQSATANAPMARAEPLSVCARLSRSASPT